MHINASFTTQQGVYIGVQADSVKEVQAAIAALLGGGNAIGNTGVCVGVDLGAPAGDNNVSVVQTPKADAKKPVSASTKKSSEASASTVTKSSEEQKPVDEPVLDQAPELEYVRDVQKRVLDFAKDNGRDKTTDMLSRYGVKSAKELKPEQWPDFIAYIDKVTAGNADPSDSDVA